MVSWLCFVAVYARKRRSNAASPPPGSGVLAINSSTFAISSACLRVCSTSVLATNVERWVKKCRMCRQAVSSSRS